MKKLLKRVRLHAAPPLALSVSVDDVIDEFYEDFATLDSGRYWWWCQMLLLDPNEIIVNDGYDNLYRIPFTTTDQGMGNPPVVEFGDPTPVRLEPVDTTAVDEEAAEYAAAKHEAVMAAVTAMVAVRGRERVAASYENRDESRPITRQKEEVQVREHIKRLRAKLGLTDDVTDEQVLAAAAVALEAEPEIDPENPDVPAVDPPTDPPVPAVVAETPAPGEPVVEARTVDASALAQLQEDARMGREARETQLRAENDQIVDAAIDIGKFPPRMRTAYLKQLNNPALRAETIAFIDELDENVVPVKMRGQSGESEAGSVAASGVHPEYEGFLTRYAPDVAAKRQAALAGATNTTQRVFKDS